MSYRILKGGGQGVEWRCWGLMHTADGTARVPTSAVLPTARREGSHCTRAHNYCARRLSDTFSGSVKTLPTLYEPSVDDSGSLGLEAQSLAP